MNDEKDEAQSHQHDAKMIEIRGRRFGPTRDEEPEREAQEEAARQAENPDEE